MHNLLEHDGLVFGHTGRQNGDVSRAQKRGIYRRMKMVAIWEYCHQSREHVVLRVRARGRSRDLRCKVEPMRMASKRRVTRRGGLFHAPESARFPLSPHPWKWNSSEAPKLSSLSSSFPRAMYVHTYARPKCITFAPRC